MTAIPRKAAVQAAAMTDRNRCRTVVRASTVVLRGELTRRPALQRYRKPQFHFAGAIHGLTTAMPQLSKSSTFRVANLAPD